MTHRFSWARNKNTACWERSIWLPAGASPHTYPREKSSNKYLRLEHTSVGVLVATSPWVAHPCRSCELTQASYISDRFQCLDFRTSGSWAEHLSERYSALTLYTLHYTVVIVDGTLRWSRVDGSTRQGTLLEPGLKTALFEAEAAASRRARKLVKASESLLTGNPLDPTVRAGGQRGRGRGTRAAGRGSGSRRGGRAGGSTDGARPSSPSAVLADEVSSPLGAGGEQRVPGDDDLEGNAGQDDEIDGYDFEGELEDMIEEDLAEMAATYADNPNPGAEEDNAQIAEPTTEILAEQSIEKAMQEEAQATGLEEMSVGHGAHEGGAMPAPSGVGEASSVAGEQEIADEPSPPALDMSSLSDPSGQGYVYQNARVVMRILRGNPKGSLSVRCYKHPNCSCLLSLRVAPPDDELKKWFLEVPAAEPGSSKEVAGALGKQHVRLANKWRTKTGTPASSSASGGAP